MEENGKIPKNVIETEITMGPVHSAAIEPYRVRLFVEDEIVRDAEINIGINHRGIEKALEIDVPERARYIRIIMAELERLHSHMLYLAHGCEVLGHETFAMRLFYIRETVMELLRMIGGNRVQYGVSIIGGIRPRCDLDTIRIQKIKEGMDTVETKITEFADRFVSDIMIMSRITGVGTLPQEDAIKLGTSGPTLRATGVSKDLRQDMKEYEPFEFDVITQDDGDVKSNLLVRVFEILEATKIIRQAIAQITEGKITNRSWEMNDAPITKSYIEAPRGTLYHSYAIEDGRVRHSIVRTPSITNIGAMQYACVGHHITDAQLAIVQCDPCFTCTDRAIKILPYIKL